MRRDMVHSKDMTGSDALSKFELDDDADADAVVEPVVWEFERSQ